MLIKFISHTGYFMETLEFNDKDLVSCIESIINVDIGICNLYHSDYDDEYKK